MGISEDPRREGLSEQACPRDPTRLPPLHARRSSCVFGIPGQLEGGPQGRCGRGEPCAPGSRNPHPRRGEPAERDVSGQQPPRRSGTRVSSSTRSGSRDPRRGSGRRGMPVGPETWAVSEAKYFPRTAPYFLPASLSFCPSVPCSCSPLPPLKPTARPRLPPSCCPAREAAAGTVRPWAALATAPRLVRDVLLGPQPQLFRRCSLPRSAAAQPALQVSLCFLPRSSVLRSPLLQASLSSSFLSLSPVPSPFSSAPRQRARSPSAPARALLVPAAFRLWARPLVEGKVRADPGHRAAGPHGQWRRLPASLQSSSSEESWRTRKEDPPPAAAASAANPPTPHLSPHKHNHHHPPSPFQTKAERGAVDQKEP